jgi:hypothetical protein
MENSNFEKASGNDTLTAELDSHFHQVSNEINVIRRARQSKPGAAERRRVLPGSRLVQAFQPFQP